MRRIGSGDTTKLLSGINTKGHKELMTKFVSEEKVYYNAKASPIDALRTGAILEDNYFELLDDNWYSQCREVCEELNVLVSTLDFARYESGKVIEFEELKTCNFNDFISIENLSDVKKNFKSNYNQVQFQLLCTGLQEATIVFLCVYTYDDEENNMRVIEYNDVKKIIIPRDENVINKIKNRAKIFQDIKNYFEQH